MYNIFSLCIIHGIKSISVLALFFSGVLLFGCSSGNSEKNSKATGKNEVVIHELSDPDMLNPICYTSAAAGMIVPLIFPSLTGIDYKTLKSVPWLADSLAKVEKKPDGKLYFTYRLRPEAKWDNGSPVTVNDIEFSLKLIKNPKVNCPNAKPAFESFTAIIRDKNDSLKFTVVCEKVYILAELASGDFPIIPEYIYDPQKLMRKYTITELSHNPEKYQNEKNITDFANEFNSEKFMRDKNFVSGCGPYSLSEWTTGQQLVLTKKKNWWGNKLKDINIFFEANIDKIIYRIISDQTSAVVSMKAGNIDVMYSIKPKEFYELPKSETFTKNFNTYTPVSLQYAFIAVNTKSPKLSDKKTRQAIAHLVDIDKIIKTVLYGYAQSIIGPIHPSKEMYYNKDIKRFDYNLETAKQLLAEAGWKDTNGDGTIDKVIKGERVEFTLDYLYNEGNDARKQIGLILQEEARKVGISMTVTGIEFNVMLDRLKTHQFETCLSSWIASPILNDFKQIYHTEAASNGGGNYMSFGNTDSDALIDSIRGELDNTKLTGMYKRFQVMVHDEAAMIYMYAPSERIAINKRFTNADPTILRPGFYAPAFKLAEN